MEAFYQAQELVAPGASFIRGVLLNMWNPEALEHGWTLPDGFQAKVKVLETTNTKIEIDELNHATFTYRHTVNEAQEKSVALAGNVIQSIDGYIVREMTRRCMHNKAKLSAAREKLLNQLDKEDQMIPSELEEWHFIRTGIASLEGLENLEWDKVAWYTHNYCRTLLRLCEGALANDSFDLICIHDEFKCHPNHMQTVRKTYRDIMAELANSTIMSSVLTELAGEEIVLEKFKGHKQLGDKIRQSEYAIS